MSSISADALHIKLAWLELSAAGSFTIGTLAVLTIMFFALSMWRRRS